MKKKNFLFPLFLFLAAAIVSCKNEDEQTTTAENDIDAAREFIRHALDGKFDKARNFLLADSINIQYIDVAKRSYDRSDNETKNGYRAASINIHKVETVSDSTTVVIYSNSFKNDHDTLRIVRTNGQWLVDLKYLYGYDRDSTGLFVKPGAGDSLHQP